jgi:hypothetical protein
MGIRTTCSGVRQGDGVVSVIEKPSARAHGSGGVFMILRTHYFFDKQVLYLPHLCFWSFGGHADEPEKMALCVPAVEEPYEERESNP